MRFQKQAAFTLVELLVVIAIIGMLVALLLPAIQAAREAARRSQCTNNLKQIGLALQMHHDGKKTYPRGRESRDQFGVAWSFELLPFMEQHAIYGSFVPLARVDSPENAVAMRTPVDTFHCPSRRPPRADRDFDDNESPSAVQGVAAGGDYAGNAGLVYNYGTEAGEVPYPRIPYPLPPDEVAGPLYTYSRVQDRHVIDGLSNTLAVGERSIPEHPVIDDVMLPIWQGDTAFFAADNPRTIFSGTECGLEGGQTDATNSICSDLANLRANQRFGGEHPGIVLFAFLDGHVQPIQEAVDILSLQRLSTIADGHVVDMQNL